MEIARMRCIDIDKKTGCDYAARAAEDALGISATEVKYLGGGSFGRAFSVKHADGDLVVKLLVDSDMMRKETHDLQLIGSACPVPVPKVLFCREADETVPAACYGMSRIEGKSALTSLSLQLSTKRKRERFADEVTTALHAIHEVKNAKFGDTLAPAFERWSDFYRPFAEEVLRVAESDPAIDDGVVAAMRSASRVYDKIFAEEPTCACLIHGDLNVANIMTDRGRVSGFIDPLNSMYADREYDLFQFRNLWGERFGFVDSYRSKYGASEMLEYKLAFYGLWNEVWCSVKVGHAIGLIMKPLVKNMTALASKLQ